MQIDRIYQGDAVEMMAHIPDGYDVVVVTDPPFNIGYHYEGYGDRMVEGDYFQMLLRVIGAANGKAVIVHYPESLHRLSIELGTDPERVLSWVYNSNTKKQHRDIAYYGFRPVMSQVVQPYKNPNDKRIRERMARGIEGGLYTTGSTSTK